MTVAGDDLIDRLPRPAAVLLARLLVPAGRSPPTVAKLRADVSAAAGPVSDEQWAQAVSALADAGLAVVARPPGRAAKATAGPLHLTGAGRTWVVDHLAPLAGQAKLSPVKVQRYWQGRDPAVDRVALSMLYLKPTPAKSLRTAVQKVTGPVDDAAWSAAVTAVVSAGRVADPAPAQPPPAAGPKPPPIGLTDAGRAAAADWLGPVPANATWPKVVAGHLFPATRPADQRAAAADGKRVAGLLVGEALAVGPADHVTGAVEAAVCVDLGFPRLRSADALVSDVIGKRLGKTLPPDLSVTDRNDLVARVLLDATRTDADALRMAAVKRWATAGRPVPAAPRRTPTICRRSPPPSAGRRPRRRPAGGATRCSSATSTATCPAARRWTRSSGDWSRPTPPAWCGSPGPTSSPPWTRPTSATRRRTT